MASLTDHWSSFAAMLLVVQAVTLTGFWWWSRKFTAPGVGAFQIVVLAMAGRTATEAVEWVFAAPSPGVLFWTLGFKCTLSSLLAAGLLLLFADVSGLNHWATPSRRRLLVAATLLLGALSFTNPWTGWISPDTATAAGWSFGRYRTGPVFLYLIAVNAAALLFAIGATLYVWHGASPLLRKQLGLLLVGYCLPSLTVFIHRANLFPPDWPNPTPLARIGAIALFAWALSREQLWRLVPIARSFVLEEHNDGLIVADRNLLVVDSNPAARQFLRLPGDATLHGVRLAQVLSPWPELAKLLGSSVTATCECQPLPTTDSYWQASWHPLRSGGAKEPRGFLLVIADITERKRTERALQTALEARTHEWQRATAAALRASEEEQNRLGHLLHDTLCQDLIGCARQADLLRTDLSAGSPVADARLASLETGLAQAGRRAREISHLLAGTIRADLPFPEKLAAVLNQLETSLGLECELAFDPSFPAPDEEQGILLMRILREAIINAARHGRARRVWIDLLTDSDRTTIMISNDGLPPPATPVDGLGMRQMRMRAALLGGSITLASPPAGGASLELSLPATLPSLPPA